MIAHRLTHTPGVREVTANPVTARILVVFDPSKLVLSQLEQLVGEAMLTPLESNGLAHRNGHADASHHTHGEGGLGGFIFRLIAGGLALGGMLIHKFFWLPIGLPPGLTFALGAGVTIVAGYPFFRGGLRSLSRFSAGDTDTLITVATIASIALRESVTALIVLWLLNLGDLLQAVVLRRTRRAIHELLSVGDRRHGSSCRRAPRSVCRSRRSEQVTWWRSTRVRRFRSTVRLKLVKRPSTRHPSPANRCPCSAIPATASLPGR
jgi:cation-transporting P-type ATPase C